MSSQRPEMHCINNTGSQATKHGVEFERIHIAKQIKSFLNVV